MSIQDNSPYLAHRCVISFYRKRRLPWGELFYPDINALGTILADHVDSDDWVNALLCLEDEDLTAILQHFELVLDGTLIRVIGGTFIGPYIDKKKILAEKVQQVRDRLREEAEEAATYDSEEDDE